MVEIEEPKFKINDTVYYNLPEGREGLILSMRYYPSTELWEYLVTWGEFDSGWVIDLELSTEKQII